MLLFTDFVVRKEPFVRSLMRESCFNERSACEKNSHSETITILSTMQIERVKQNRGSIFKFYYVTETRMKITTWSIH